MTDTVDRRIAQRRRGVREAGARRRLRRLLVAMTAVAVAAAIGWLLLQSSVLAVSAVEVDGVENSRATEIIATFGVEPGVPTLSVDAAALESALASDPFVERASVRVTWPGTIEVTVLEHVPAGWVSDGDRWVLATADGMALLVTSDVPGSAPVVWVSSADAAPGTHVRDAAAAPGLEFLGLLPGTLARGASLWGTPDMLHAVVAGHQVELGTGTDMAAKAQALIALLADGLPEGAYVNLVSPTRPAVLYPQLVIEASESDQTSSVSAG